MKVVGLDPSSKFGGYAIAVNRELIKVKTWKPSNKNLPQVRRLIEYDRWLSWQLGLDRPDMALVEQLGVFMNASTVRVLSHYEGTALLACGKRVPIVLNPLVTSARKHALGRGDIAKEKAFAMLKKLYPEIEFGVGERDGGYDRADAAVMALAGESFAEDRKR